MSENGTDTIQGGAAPLDAVRAAYGGDPNDPAWQTPEGIAGIIEELSGLVRVTAAQLAGKLVSAERLLRECAESIECGITGKTYRCVSSASPDEYCEPCQLRERVRHFLATKV